MHSHQHPSELSLGKDYEVALHEGWARRVDSLLQPSMRSAFQQQLADWKRNRLTKPFATAEAGVQAAKSPEFNTTTQTEFLPSFSSIGVEGIANTPPSHSISPRRSPMRFHGNDYASAPSSAATSQPFAAAFPQPLPSYNDQQPSHYGDTLPASIRIKADQKQFRVQLLRKKLEDLSTVSSPGFNKKATAEMFNVLQEIEQLLNEDEPVPSVNRISPERYPTPPPPKRTPTKTTEVQTIHERTMRDSQTTTEALPQPRFETRAMQVPSLNSTMRTETASRGSTPAPPPLPSTATPIQPPIGYTSNGGVPYDAHTVAMYWEWAKAYQQWYLSQRLQPQTSQPLSTGFSYERSSNPNPSSHVDPSFDSTSQSHSRTQTQRSGSQTTERQQKRHHSASRRSVAEMAANQLQHRTLSSSPSRSARAGRSRSGGSLSKSTKHSTDETGYEEDEEALSAMIRARLRVRQQRRYAKIEARTLATREERIKLEAGSLPPYVTSPNRPKNHRYDSSQRHRQLVNPPWV